MDIITRIIFWMDMRKSNNDIYYFIARTILQHSEQISTMGIEELANLCYTSPATISRFCRKLSFKSFIDLKQAFQWQHEYTKKEVIFTEVEQKSIVNNPAILAEKSLTMSIDALIETYQIIDMQHILQVVQILKEAKHIAIFGSIYSQLVARDCQYKFLRLNKFTTAFSDMENQLADADDLTQDDAAIIFSVSGRAPKLIEVAKIAKAKNTPVIVITNKVDSSIAKLADVIIPIGGRESQFTQSSMSGRIASMGIVDLLYTTLAYELSIK